MSENQAEPGADDGRDVPSTRTRRRTPAVGAPTPVAPAGVVEHAGADSPAATAARIARPDAPTAAGRRPAGQPRYQPTRRTAAAASTSPSVAVPGQPGDAAGSRTPRPGTRPGHPTAGAPGPAGPAPGDPGQSRRRRRRVGRWRWPRCDRAHRWRRRRLRRLRPARRRRRRCRSTAATSNGNAAPVIDRSSLAVDRGRRAADRCGHQDRHRRGLRRGHLRRRLHRHQQPRGRRARAATACR